MPLLYAIPLWFLIAGASVCAVYYSVILGRALRTARSIPTAAAGLSLPEPEGGWPRVCIVIPAHNEAAVIDEHARSLLAQDYPALSIVFSLDRCTDDTETILRRRCSVGGSLDPRVEIVRVTECPEGWAGKTNAAWQGVQQGSAARNADLLLFADADTIFHPGLVRACVALLRARKLDLLSLLSGLTSDHWFERLVQPAAGFELVRQYPLDIVNRAERPRAFANGQFMLFTREVYNRLGGHEAVRHELLEDMAFARQMERLRKRGTAPAGVLMAGGLLTCRMYRSWEAFRRGWKRIYTEAALRRPRQLAEWAWRQRLAGVLLPLVALGALVAGAMVWRVNDLPLAASLLASGAAGLLAFALAMARIYRDQGLPAWLGLTYPLGAWRVAGILGEAAADLRAGRKTVWGGREYTREARA